MTERDAARSEGIGLVIAATLLSAMGLMACTSPPISGDHQMLRVRVVRVWTDQEMTDDWLNHMRSLTGAPPLESYLREYRRETVFLGYAGRGDRYEYSLAVSTMHLAPGDIVELDIGGRSRPPIAFADIPLARNLVCRATEIECINDAKRSPLGRLDH